jgi:hypothetical protein
MEEQSALKAHAEQISSRLQFFLELEKATIYLNSTSVVVFSPAFITLLRKLDHSILFLAQKVFNIF